MSFLVRTAKRTSIDFKVNVVDAGGGSSNAGANVWIGELTFGSFDPPNPMFNGAAVMKLSWDAGIQSVILYLQDPPINSGTASVADTTFEKLVYNGVVLLRSSAVLGTSGGIGPAGSVRSLRWNVGVQTFPLTGQAQAYLIG